MKNKFILLLFFFSSINIYPISLFHIDENNMQNTVTKAIDGDAESAYELSLYYEFNREMSYIDRTENTLYWLVIAAENDLSGKYMKELSSYLYCLESTNRTRALYWIYKSSDIGYSESSELIQQVYEKYKFSFSDDKEYIKFNKENINYFEDGALRGSGNAALLLAEYYKDEKNLETSQYWSRIGAQNMNEKCIELYIEYLKKTCNENDKNRIIFWDKRLKTISRNMAR